MVFFILFALNRRQKIPKGQLRMNNPEIHITLTENKQSKYYSNKSKRRTTHTPPRNGGGGWVKPETREK